MNISMDPLAAPDVAAARDEVKAWLRIGHGDDDAAIAALARAAIGHAEDFCRQTMIVRGGMATLPASTCWSRIGTGPVRGIGAVETLAADGTASALAVDGYAIDIDASGDGWVRLTQHRDAGRMRAPFSAGIAPDWASLPDGLRQGIVRLAAHLFTAREEEGPPAIVSALWMPWRRMRLA